MLLSEVNFNRLKFISRILIQYCRIKLDRKKNSKYEKIIIEKKYMIGCIYPKI